MLTDPVTGHTVTVTAEQSVDITEEIATSDEPAADSPADAATADAIESVATTEAPAPSAEASTRSPPETTLPSRSRRQLPSTRSRSSAPPFARRRATGSSYTPTPAWRTG